MDRFEQLSKLSTFDLAFNLATGKYSTEEDKFLVLDIIKGRDAGNVVATVAPKKEKLRKAPLKGSKAEKIQQLADKKWSAKDIFDYMNDKKNKLPWKKTYYPEIYRILNNQ